MDATSERIARLVREEAPPILGALVRTAGSLERAEELFQEALVKAMEVWPRTGIPERPGAWLLTTARHRAIDDARKARFVSAEEAPEGVLMPPEEPEVLEDDALRLFFVCCHPVLSRDSQVALTLRLVAGLTTEEIARAFLSTEPTVAQRLVRAKRTLQEAHVPFEVPGRAQLQERLEPVLQVLYLLFNEGYGAHRGDALVRVDLMAEAIRLGGLLFKLLPHESEVSGLLSLMELQASRSAARVDAKGDLVLLADQDRSLWDVALIQRARARLAGAEGEGPYELQALISACHARSPSWGQTDFAEICALYDRLLQASPGPVVELNLVAAVSMRDGPEAGLARLEAMEDASALEDYVPFHATRADLLRRLSRHREAASAYRRAAKLTQNEREQAFFTKRAEESAAQKA